MNLFEFARELALTTLSHGTRRQGGGFVECDVDILRYAMEYTQNAYHLYFDRPAHQELDSDRVLKEHPSALAKEFFLPRSPLAIEDPASVVVLYDVQKNQHGAEAARVYLEIQRAGADAYRYTRFRSSPVEALQADMEAEPDELLFSLGVIRRLKIVNNGEFYPCAELHPIAEIGVSRFGIVGIQIRSSEFFREATSVNINAPSRFAPVIEQEFPLERYSGLIGNVATTYALLMHHAFYGGTSASQQT